MRLATIVSLSASAVLGVGALFVAKVWLPANSGPSRAVAAAPAIALTPVVAAKDAIPFGHKLEAKDLMLVRMPADAAPTGAFHSIDEVVRLDNGGAVTLTAFSPKEPILPSKVSGGANRASLSAVISPGMRAYTIKVNDTYGGGGHILPGDRVDVLMAKVVGDGQVEGSAPKLMVAYVIIQDVRVLGMDLNADPASTDKALPKTATLEVSVTDAEKLSVAGEAGILSLALRRIGSAGIDAVGPIRSGDLGPSRLVDAPRPAARRIVRKPSTAKAAASAQAGSTLTITQGGKATTVSVPADRSGARW